MEKIIVFIILSLILSNAKGFKNVAYEKFKTAKSVKNYINVRYFRMVMSVKIGKNRDIKHIAVDFDIGENEISNNFIRLFSNINSLIKFQIIRKISILTIGLPKVDDDKIVEFLKFYVNKSFIDSNKIKISFIGKWYDMSSNLVSEIKRLLDISRDYDIYYLNFAVNYDGYEEIADACKLVVRKVMNNKISIDAVNEAIIKENLSTSNFISPDLIIKTGNNSINNKLNGFLLWDSKNSKIVFTNKSALDFRVEDFL